MVYEEKYNLLKFSPYPTLQKLFLKQPPGQQVLGDGQQRYLFSQATGQTYPLLFGLVLTMTKKEPKSIDFTTIAKRPLFRVKLQIETSKEVEVIISIFTVAIVGLALSAYAFYLEQKIGQDASYKPACDISDKVSCSKPILSPYGKILGFSNSIAGIVFYAIIAILAIMGATLAIFILALAAAFASVYLAWVLYSKIHAACLVCCAIYAVNLILLILSFIHLI